MPPNAWPPRVQLIHNDRDTFQEIDEEDESVSSIMEDDAGSDTLSLASPGIDDIQNDSYLQRPSSSNGSTGGRNRSPYSRTHLRSRSSSALLSTSSATRARSMPNQHINRVPSPPNVTGAPSSKASALPFRGPRMASPARTRSPLGFEDGAGSRGPATWAYESSPIALTGSHVQTIQEDSELDITPSASLSPVALPAASSAFARSSSLRRRPASPLHSAAGGQFGPSSSSFSDSSSLSSPDSQSPSLGPTRFTEAYPSLHHYASNSSFSSIPSTPTSLRSRSPSISSLNTIEDAPDLESEAIELERIERLKQAAERAERAERGEEIDDAGRRRGSLDVPRRMGRAGSERKRWSICGGERRADLDLETIWED